MKKFASLILVSSLLFSVASHAEESWFDSFKSMLGLGASAEESAAESAAEASAAIEAATLSMTGMISALTENLELNSDQVEGGLASLMNYVKNNVSSDKFSALSSSLPGLEQVLTAVPEITAVADGGMAGLLSKASEYSSKLKDLNAVKQQFEALGLSPDMISAFVEQAKAYLDTPQGQEAKALLTSSLSSLI